jgi:hypothetical protein
LGQQQSTSDIDMRKDKTKKKDHFDKARKSTLFGKNRKKLDIDKINAD